MTTLQPLLSLACWLAGEFENRAQAIEHPSWFVHLRLWQRPLPNRIEGKLSLFAEQANALYLDQSYRQRVMVLSQVEGTDQLHVQYLGLKQPEKFQGAGANPSLLAKLTLADLDWLPGCCLTVKRQDDTFHAQMLPSNRCRFHYQDKVGEVILGFEVSPDRFCSYDRGVDPETGQSLWGALMGPYKFSKRQDFAGELPQDW